MPRFYFDRRDPDGRLVRDDDGLDLDGETAARDAAALAATEMAGGLANLDRGELAVKVRDQNGHPTCEVALSIRVSRH